jgi:hypothetical protein
VSTNKKYTIPDLKDDRTMQESMKRVRELLIERTSKTTKRARNNRSEMDI